MTTLCLADLDRDRRLAPNSPFDGLRLERRMKTDGVNLETGEWAKPRAMIVTLGPDGRVLGETPELGEPE